MTGLDVDLACAIIFLVCIFYTAIGGIKAVMWTDTFQVEGHPTRGDYSSKQEVILPEEIIVQSRRLSYQLGDYSSKQKVILPGRGQFIKAGSHLTI